MRHRQRSFKRHGASVASLMLLSAIYGKLFQVLGRGCVVD